MSNSPSRSRDAFLRPGFASLLHSPRTEGWAERRETFGCVRSTRWACHSASKTRVNALTTRHARRLARRLASHNAGRSPLGAPPWRFFTRGRASVSGITRIRSASSSQPGRSAWRATSRASRGERLRAAAAGRHASSGACLFDLIEVFTISWRQPPERPRIQYARKRSNQMDLCSHRECAERLKASHSKFGFGHPAQCRPVPFRQSFRAAGAGFIPCPLVQHLRLGPARFHRSDERVLNLFLYRPQPLLSACRAALKTLNLAFQFPDPIFGSSQLKREPMCHCHRSFDVLFRDVSCFFEQTNHGVPSLINRLKFASWPLLRSKSNEFS